MLCYAIMWNGDLWHWIIPVTLMMKNICVIAKLYLLKDNKSVNNVFGQDLIKE